MQNFFLFLLIAGMLTVVFALSWFFPIVSLAAAILGGAGWIVMRVKEAGDKAAEEVMKTRR